MSAPAAWQPAFLAFSAFAKEPLAVAVEAIGGEGTEGIAEILRELGSPSRDTRGKAVARVATAVVAGLDGAVAS